MLNIVWFKRDLRIADHAPLLRAVGEGIVVPLFIAEPGYWARPTTSARQWRFVARSLAALRTQLAVLGAPLVVRVGEAVEVFETLRQQSTGMVIWSHHETADAFGRARNAAVGAWAAEHAIPWHELPQTGVFRGNRTREDWGARWQEAVEAEPLPAPDQMIAHGLVPGKIVSERILYLDDDPCMDLAAGPAVARRLMKNYFETGEETGPDSGPDLQALDGEPRISAHVSLGTLSLREIHHLMRHEFADRSVIPFPAVMARLRERTDLLQRFEDQPDQETAPMHPAFAALDASEDPDMTARWEAGQTGYPMVDATMRALAGSGWVSPEKRVLALSVAIWRLEIDWRTAGTAMARLLTNYEPGVHWCLTQMAAGLTVFDDVDPVDPTAAIPGLDADGTFVRRWVPELAGVPTEWLATPWAMPVAAQADAGCRIGPDYPAPPDGAEERSAERQRQRDRIAQTPGFAEVAQDLFRRHHSNQGFAKESLRLALFARAG